MLNLANNKLEHVAYMLEEIKNKLKMASGHALKATELDDEQYADLYDLYQMVAAKKQFSISEIEAITMELGRLRKG